MDGEGVDGAGKFLRKHRIHHPVALDPAFAGEGLRDDVDPEMRLALRPVAGVARVKMGFVDDCRLSG